MYLEVLPVQREWTFIKPMRTKEHEKTLQQNWSFSKWHSWRSWKHFQRRFNTAALLMSFPWSLMGPKHCFPNLGSHSKCVFCQSTENLEMAYFSRRHLPAQTDRLISTRIKSPEVWPWETPFDVCNKLVTCARGPKKKNWAWTQSINWDELTE